MLWLLYDNLPWKRWKGCKISNCSKVEKKKAKNNIIQSCCFFGAQKKQTVMKQSDGIESNIKKILMMEGGNLEETHTNMGRVCQLHTERSSNPKLALWPWSRPWDSQSVCLTAWAICRLLWYVYWWIYLSCSNSPGLLFYYILEWNSKSTQFQRVLKW